MMLTVAFKAKKKRKKAAFLKMSHYSFKNISTTLSVTFQDSFGAYTLSPRTHKTPAVGLSSAHVSEFEFSYYIWMTIVSAIPLCPSLSDENTPKDKREERKARKKQILLFSLPLSLDQCQEPID